MRTEVSSSRASSSISRGPVIPALGLLVLKTVLGAEAQRTVVLDHLLHVFKPLVDVQGF